MCERICIACHAGCPRVLIATPVRSVAPPVVPLMAGGILVPIFGDLVGTGAGAGMAVLFVITGVLGALSGLAGYAFPFIRDIEDILLDHDAKPKRKLKADDEVIPSAVS